MRKLLILLMSFCLMFCGIVGGSIKNVSALENENYTVYESISKEEIHELLTKYKKVTVYSNGKGRTSGTHSTYSISYKKDFSYGFIGYHPDTPNWSMATGYSVSKSKTRSFSISVSANVTKSVSISVGAAASSTDTFSMSFGFGESEIALIRNGTKRSRLAIYARTHKEMWHYNVYDNASGQLLQSFDTPYVTTWDGDNNINEVDYKAVLN